jgi:hypothetical protein
MSVYLTAGALKTQQGGVQVPEKRLKNDLARAA